MTDPIIQRLDALAQQSPDLKAITALYKSILPILRDADVHAEPIALTEDVAHAKLQAGLPLLHDIDLAVDVDAVCNLMIRLALAIEQMHADTPTPKRRLPFLRANRPEASALYESALSGDDATLRAAAARQIRFALEQNKIEMSTLLPRIASGDNKFVAALASSLQLDAGLLWTIAQNAFKPALRQWAKQLIPLVRGVLWNQGFCFVCGAGATLGELQGNDQEKHLRCGQCGADWQFDRLRCAVCGNDDHKTLSYLYPEKERDALRVRIDICDQCHGYLKTISAFAPTLAELLAVEDLATLHLDYIAQERGYARVAVR